MSTLYLIGAAVLLAGLGQKLYELRGRWDDPVRRAVCLCLTSLAAATLAQLFALTVGHGTGTARLADVTSDVGAMVAAHAGRLFLIHVNHPAGPARVRARRCRLSLAVALTALTILFLAFPPTPARTDPSYTSGVYFYVYIWYVAVTLASVCGLSGRYARLTDRRSLRLGLRFIAASAVCGLAFLAVQAVMLVGDELGAGLSRWDRTAALPLELTTELLLAVGATIPVWGARLGAAVRWVRDHRSYRLLYPLWLALHNANPELALLPNLTGRGLWHRDVGFLLYRQVIEIRDGQLALRPYVDAGVAETAAALARRAGLPAREARIHGEAAAVAAGIAAKRQGRPPRTTPAAPDQTPDGADLTTEIAWLTEVSRAFATSPIVPMTLATAPRRGASEPDDLGARVAPSPHKDG